jgi:hypothetical protein
MKNMEIIDANIVLRYLLNDHETLSKKSAKILENKSVHFPFEVCAEVVYVLEKVYNVPTNDRFYERGDGWFGVPAKPSIKKPLASRHCDREERSGKQSVHPFRASWWTKREAICSSFQLVPGNKLIVPVILRFGKVEGH